MLSDINPRYSWRQEVLKLAARKSEAEWKQAIADCKASSLSIKKWCEKNQIKVSTYKYWFTRLNKENDSVSNICWAEMKVPVEQPEVLQKTSFITIRYGNFSVDISEITDHRLLAEVLKTLQSIC
jgi:hypothetical protein